MNTGIKTVLQRSVFAVCATLTLTALMPDPGFAQRYLETKRQKCPDRAKVTTPGLPAPVGAYEARSADVTTPNVTLQCEGQPQQPVECPPGTNRILIDRSQGGGVFSIICLRK